MADYPNIGDHGLIGDLQTAALVDTDGTIGWFCCPRFDSPSVFASLLDADRGGHFRLAPDGVDHVTRQLYLPETAILVTRFMSEGGVGEVVDFMPVADGPATDRHRIVRLVRVVRGTMRFVADIQPRFDYARTGHRTELTDDGAVFESDDLTLVLHRVSDPVTHGTERAGKVERDGDGVRVTITLQAGETTGVVLESGACPTSPDRGRRAHRPVPPDPRLLAALARPIDLHRAMARGRHEIGHDAQADDLRADRGAGGRTDLLPCPSRSEASGTGTTATRGSATRRSASTPCSAWDTSTKRRRSCRGSSTASTRASARDPAR